MYEIRIPNEVYEQAVQAAEAQHVSIEQFVTETLELRLRADDQAIQKMFTPERLAHIAKADAEIDAGNFFTSEQVDEYFANKHKAWQEEHPH